MSNYQRAPPFFISAHRIFHPKNHPAIKGYPHLFVTLQLIHRPSCLFPGTTLHQCHIDVPHRLQQSRETHVQVFRHRLLPYTWTQKPGTYRAPRNRKGSIGQSHGLGLGIDMLVKWRIKGPQITFDATNCQTWAWLQQIWPDEISIETPGFPS